MTLQLDRVDHIHIYVQDREAAEAWYGRVLGLKRVEELAFWAPGPGPLTLSDADGHVHLALFGRSAVANRTTVAFGVSAEAFLAWRSHLGKELGEVLNVVDHDASWSMYFTDPWGNPYEITCYDYDVLAAGLR